MEASDWNRHFLESTRGRILDLLRVKDRTVIELAEALGIVDNTVRVHLITLERDGLVEQRGKRRGLRKPHYIYHLTTTGENLFLHACDPLLDNLLGVLSTQLSSSAFEDVLRAVGRRMALRHSSVLVEAGQTRRLESGITALGELGGLATLKADNDKISIEGYRCPLSSIVARYPQACLLAESLLTEIIGSPVQEDCIRGGGSSLSF